jgi:hypothetical protein
MSIRPSPSDANGNKLIDTGSQILTDRISLTTATRAIQFGEDIKGLILYVESGTVIIRGVAAFGKEFLDAEAAIDAGGGDVTLNADGHGFTTGDSVTITGTTNYDGTYTITAATDTITITATYVAETIPATAYMVGYRDARLAAASTWSLPVAVHENTTVCTLSAATTAVVSIVAWR